MAAIYKICCTPGSDKLTVTTTWESSGAVPTDYRDICTIGLSDQAVIVASAPARKQLDIYGMLAQGAGLEKKGEVNVKVGYDLVRGLYVGGAAHIVGYEANAGKFDFYRIDSGYGLELVYSYSVSYGQVSIGFTTIEAYSYKGAMLLLGYNTDSGDVKVYQLQVAAETPLSMTCIWNKEWSPGWVRFTFFDLGGEHFFLKSNIKHNTVYIDHLNDDPATGSSPVGRHLPLPLDLDIVRTFTLDGSIRILAYRKSGDAVINRLHVDCQGWHEESAFKVLPNATSAISICVDDASYILLY